MRFRVEVICLHEDGAQERCGVMDLERHELAIETMAITPCETRFAEICGLSNLRRSGFSDQKLRAICSVTAPRRMGLVWERVQIGEMRMPVGVVLAAII